MGCGVGIFGRLLAERGFTNIMGVDACEPHLAFATASGNYKEGRCMWLGLGTDKFPADLKNRFDLVVAGGVWLIGHLPKEGMLDAHAALKDGGFFVLAMRKTYWVNGEKQGYKDMVDQLVSEGKFTEVKRASFIRGTQTEGIMAAQEQILLVLKKTA
jgi:predicted TPR repeat methyltransferase